MWSRIYLIPALTAEEDRDLARRYYADQAREKQLLGGNTSPYNSDKYAYLDYGHEMGEWSADSGTDTFAQLSRLPRESAPSKDRILLDVREKAERCTYVKEEGSNQTTKNRLFHLVGSTSPPILFLKGA